MIKPCLAIGNILQHENAYLRNRIAGKRGSKAQSSDFADMARHILQLRHDP